MFFLEKKNQGFLPITHPEMTRFWITLSHGVNFVLKSLEIMTGGETFIPKIPSMSIMDLARFIAPECKIKTVGIRQGEKIHETLVSKDEARKTLEGKNFYLIKPDNAFFESRIDEKDLKPVPLDFEYSSSTNREWMTKEQVQKMIIEK